MFQSEWQKHHIDRRNTIQCIATKSPIQWITILPHMQIKTMHVLGGDCTIRINFFTYYAGIMLDAFSTYYAQNYASIIGSVLASWQIATMHVHFILFYTCKGVALQYVLYSDLCPWSRWKSRVKIADGQESKLLLSGQGSTTHFSKTTAEIICST